ncbi:SBBP repeat-containing protein [Nemorincola caseinilytica]
MGVKQWGTYYGTGGPEWNGASCNDGYVIYLTGWTSSTSGHSTAFAHQTAYGGGGSDAVLAKFFANGARSWVTYYGGAGSETVGSVTCDIFKNIYLFGHTNSNDNISTPSAFQPTRGGMMDAFLVKFHPEIGFRMWGTYIGGAQDEKAEKSRITTDDSANIYVTGVTFSTSNIASDTAWQTVYGGGDGDGFLAKFNHIGERKWCSYLGGDQADEPRGLSCLGDAVFVCGRTSSHDSIATPGALQPTGGGGAFDYQGFLEKFSDPDTSSIPEDTTTVPTLVNHTNNNAGKMQIGLFPNPNNGSFTLQGSLGNRTGIAAYTVTDIAGRVLLSDKTAVHAGNVHEQVMLNDIAPGIYFLRLRSPEGYEQVVRFRKE